MHDTDRTTLEFRSGMDPFQSEYLESPFELPGEEISMMEGEQPLTQEEEMALATELLEIRDEAELDQFLGGLIKRFAPIARRIGGPVLRQVGGALKNVAKTALPHLGKLAGTALGSYLGPLAPLGGMLGGQLGQAAAGLFGEELAGLNEEEMNFEVARRYVRFAADAVRKSAPALAGTVPPSTVRSAVLSAARKYAPGLVQSGGVCMAPARSDSLVQSGRWFRRGRRIILVGV